MTLEGDIASSPSVAEVGEAGMIGVKGDIGERGAREKEFEVDGVLAVECAFFEDEFECEWFLKA